MNTILFSLFLAQPLISSEGCLPDDRFVSLINTSIEACVTQDWDLARQPLDSLIKAHPEEPAPWFYRATVHSYRMTDEESFRLEERFLADLDSAEQRVERSRSASVSLSTEELDFLEGSIAAWRAYHHGRRGQVWSALPFALRAAHQLEDLHERCPDWADLSLGIGNLRFWKSVRLKGLAWLPFLKDERQEGIALTIQAKEEGTFSPLLAKANLCWMYLEEGMWEETLLICDQVLSVYPESRLFLFPQAEAHLAAKELAQAEQAFAHLQDLLEEDEHPQRFNRFLCLEKRSGIAQLQGEKEEARELIRQALAIKLGKDEQRRLEKRMDRLKRRKSELGDTD